MVVRARGPCYAKIMLSIIKSFLNGDAEQASQHTTDDVPAAAAAILVETAMLDGSFDESERRTIHAILVDRFALSGDDADALIETAAIDVEDAGANGVYAATRTIRDRFSEEERIDVMEMLWRVAYADGSLHDYEANLVRRVAGLLYVRDKDSGDARKRALRSMGMSETE
jgi:uncharacterized tellurite resistance protein B-like protein